jgi:tetratricopeptide (TPR) repeat protein
MTPGQIFLSVASVALIGVLYFFVPTVASKKTTQPTEVSAADNGEGHQHPDFDLASYKAARVAALPADVQSNIEALENEAATKEVLLQLNELYLQNRIPLLACEAIKAIAEKENVATDWDKAGDAYMAVSMIEEKNAGLSHYALEAAISSYRKATELNPENTDYTVKLASAIMEMGEEAMQGVQLLLGIIKENPDHIPANLILGRYGIVSGQFDKAVQRLEKVVKLDPTNTEAYFYLAEAYNGIGRKEDAIETFEKCKKLVNDTEFSAEIDNYITKIKNS